MGTSSDDTGNLSSAFSYASKLSKNAYRGKLNLKEVKDPPRVYHAKVEALARMIAEANHVVVITGAGISTSAGINDFRGPNGIWTQERRGEPAAPSEVSFETAIPTIAHMALVELHSQGMIKFLISQNVDGLHLRSGFPRDSLAELHGNVFAEFCRNCETEYIRRFEVGSIGLKETGNQCDHCGSRLVDRLLDWNDELPEKELSRAKQECDMADLCIVMGSSMQMVPSRGLPLRTIKHGGRLVCCNLSKTDLDNRAAIVLRAELDATLLSLLDHFKLSLPPYLLSCPVFVKWPTVSEHQTAPATPRAFAAAGYSGAAFIAHIDVVGGTTGKSGDSDTAEILIQLSSGKSYSFSTCRSSESHVEFVPVAECGHKETVEEIRTALDEQIKEGIETAIASLDPMTVFYRSLRTRGFATCTLCDMDVHAAQKKRHVKTCEGATYKAARSKE